MTDDIMYDSTSPASIPAGATIIAYYLNGDYTWTADELARFPDAFKLGISVKGVIAAPCYDIEQGDYSPVDAPTLVNTARAAGIIRPSLYFSRDLYPTVRQYIGVPGEEWAWWCADATGQPHTVEEDDGGIASAVQYGWGSSAYGRFDISCINDITWPLYIPPTKENLDMCPAVVTVDEQGRPVVKVYAIGQGGQRDGHLLEFTRLGTDPTANDVRDITFQIEGVAAAGTPPYTVSSV